MIGPSSSKHQRGSSKRHPGRGCLPRENKNEVKVVVLLTRIVGAKYSAAVGLAGAVIVNLVV